MKAEMLYNEYRNLHHKLNREIDQDPALEKYRQSVFSMSNHVITNKNDPSSYSLLEEYMKAIKSMNTKEVMEFIHEKFGEKVPAARINHRTISPVRKEPVHHKTSDDYKPDLSFVRMTREQLIDKKIEEEKKKLQDLEKKISEIESKNNRSSTPTRRQGNPFEEEKTTQNDHPPAPGKKRQNKVFSASEIAR